MHRRYELIIMFCLELYFFLIIILCKHVRRQWHFFHSDGLGWNVNELDKKSEKQSDVVTHHLTIASAHFS